jgi:hypothetical protein
MKHARIVFASVFVAVLFMAIAPQLNAQRCSRATVAGDWAGTLTGTIILPTGGVPAAAIVRISADLAGILSGTEARIFGGEFVRENLSGTWTVNPDCTGRVAANIFQSGVLTRTVVLAVVFDSLSTELRMVQKSLTLPVGTSIPVVITLEGK